MAHTPDPFAHHPELRDKVTRTEAESIYRHFDVETMFADRPELAWVKDEFYTDAVREADRAATLARHDGGDLWVFAYGSLMWNPALYYAEVRRAKVPGYARQFTLKDIYGARGTREAPGLMAALDTGEVCDGLAFRIAAEDVERETEVLWRRECIGPGYRPVFVDAGLDTGRITALTFVADHDAEAIVPDLCFEDQVECLARGEGFLGSSRDYLASVVDHLRLLGIRDEATEALLDAVDARRAEGAMAGRGVA